LLIVSLGSEAADSSRSASAACSLDGLLSNRSHTFPSQQR